MSLTNLNGLNNTREILAIDLQDTIDCDSQSVNFVSHRILVDHWSLFEHNAE